MLSHACSDVSAFGGEVDPLLGQRPHPDDVVTRAKIRIIGGLR
jgi:hypothetical protein